MRTTFSISDNALCADNIKDEIVFESQGGLTEYEYTYDAECSGDERIDSYTTTLETEEFDTEDDRIKGMTSAYIELLQSQAKCVLPQHELEARSIFLQYLMRNSENDNKKDLFYTIKIRDIGIIPEVLEVIYGSKANIMANNPLILNLNKFLETQYGSSLSLDHSSAGKDIIKELAKEIYSHDKSQFYNLKTSKEFISSYASWDEICREVCLFMDILNGTDLSKDCDTEDYVEDGDE